MQIIISRPKQYADRTRVYKLRIDGNLVAKIKANEEVCITIPEGAQTLHATIDWCSSNHFSLINIKDNEKLEVKNSYVRKIWIPFYPLYAITFKKNSYLNIARVR